MGRHRHLAVSLEFVANSCIISRHACENEFCLEGWSVRNDESFSPLCLHCVCSYCSSAREWVSPASQVEVRAQHGCVLRQVAQLGGEEGTAAGESGHDQDPQSAVAEFFRLRFLHPDLLRRPQLRG